MSRPPGPSRAPAGAQGSQQDDRSDGESHSRARQAPLSLAARLGLKSEISEAGVTVQDISRVDTGDGGYAPVHDLSSLGARLLDLRGMNANDVYNMSLNHNDHSPAENETPARATASLLRSKLLAKRIGSSPPESVETRVDVAVTSSVPSDLGGRGSATHKRERSMEVGECEKGKVKVPRGASSDDGDASAAASHAISTPSSLPQRPTLPSIPNPPPTQDPKDENRREQLKRLNAAYSRIRVELEELKTSSDDAHKLKDLLQSSQEQASDLQAQLAKAIQDQTMLTEAVLRERAGRRVADTKLAAAQRELDRYRDEHGMSRSTSADKSVVDVADASASSSGASGEGGPAQPIAARQAGKEAEDESKEAKAKLDKLSRTNTALQTLRKSATDRADALQHLNAVLQAQLASAQGNAQSLERTNEELRQRAEEARASSDTVRHANTALRAQVELLWGQVQHLQMRQAMTRADRDGPSGTSALSTPFVLGPAGLRVDGLAVDGIVGGRSTSVRTMQRPPELAASGSEAATAGDSRVTSSHSRTGSLGPDIDGVTRRHDLEKAADDVSSQQDGHGQEGCVGTRAAGDRAMSTSSAD